MSFIRNLVRITDEPSSVIRTRIHHTEMSRRRGLSVERGEGGARGWAQPCERAPSPPRGTALSPLGGQRMKGLGGGSREGGEGGIY